jgi:rhamnosyltransferase
MLLMTGTTESAIDTFTNTTHLLKSTVIIIPTFNASRLWGSLQAGLDRQGIPAHQIMIVDSSSTDGTQDLVRKAGYRLEVVDRAGFRHGRTRQMAADLVPDGGILVYLTQDAIPAEAHSISHLVDAFRDPTVGAAYGRQLPRPEADPIERHARLFNYPSISVTRDFESRKEFGIKAAFFSNSFAAYRRTAFDEVGGFKKQSIVSEEVIAVAQMLMKGWRIAYQADATVIHSHAFTLTKEFSRYFDIGVNHGRERWLLETFGSAGGEGRRFVVSEAKFLLKTKPSLLPMAAIRTLNKMLGYECGKHEAYLPNALKMILSDQPNCWRDEREETHHPSVVAARRP